MACKPRRRWMGGWTAARQQGSDEVGRLGVGERHAPVLGNEATRYDGLCVVTTERVPAMGEAPAAKEASLMHELARHRLLPVCHPRRPCQTVIASSSFEMSQRRPWIGLLTSRRTVRSSHPPSPRLPQQIRWAGRRCNHKPPRSTVLKAQTEERGSACLGHPLLLVAHAIACHLTRWRMHR